MTFTEAAAQVLRLVGKPLHYKEITDVAIEKNLLSHVGKSPEVTMGARLAALVKKGDKENPLVRIKPGVFALREWDQATIDQGLLDRTPALERLATQGYAGEPEPEEGAEDASSAEAASSPVAAHVRFEDEEGALPRDESERERAQLAAHATELFASEDDDDEPIFGGASEEEPALGDAAGPGAGGRRRRRRGRGRSRGDERGDDLPTYTVSDAPADLPEVGAQEGAPREVAVRDTAPRDNERQDRGDRDRGDRDRGPSRRDDRDRDRDRRDDRDRDRRDARPDRGGPMEDLVGRELADSLESLLGTFDRGRGPVAIQTAVEAAQRRGRLSGDQAASAGLFLAAARADNLRSAQRGMRPRFRVSGNRLALTEWQLDGELMRLERDLLATADRYRDAVRRSMARTLQDLSHRGLGELVTLVLEHLGFSELGQVRRPGSHGAELHLSGKARSAAGELKTAIVVRRDGREVGRERVTELRGALHHYGPAQAGMIITTGQVLSGAREEALAPGAAPVSVIDGLGFAKLCEEHAVGMTTTRVELPLPDLELFDALR